MQNIDCIYCKNSCSLTVGVRRCRIFGDILRHGYEVPNLNEKKFYVPSFKCEHDGFLNYKEMEDDKIS